MSQDALIQLASTHTVERHHDPRWTREGRTLYERDGFRFLPSETTVPLIVDHDEERVVGQVRDFMTLDALDGPWIHARATVEDAPYWLKRGTPASFAFLTLHTREYVLGGKRVEVVANAVVHEVSLLSPSVQPAERLAQVVRLEDRRRQVVPPIALSPARSSSDRSGSCAPVSGRCSASGERAFLKLTTGR